MKIINTQIKKIKNNKIIIPLKVHYTNIIAYNKYLPSFTKEWKNIIYTYNKNTLRNIPINYSNINKTIKIYFNSYFKNWQFIKDKYNIFRKKRAKYLNQIYLSDADIKYTNNKAIVTLYIINAEKNKIYSKYKLLNKFIRNSLTNHFIKIYKNLPKKLNYLLINSLKKQLTKMRKSIINKKSLVNSKFNDLDTLTKLNYYYIKKIWAIIEKKYLTKRKYFNKKNVVKKLDLNSKNLFKRKKRLSKRSLQWYLLLLRRYQLIYSLNQYKFSKSKFLPVLSNYLQKLVGKKIEYNFVKLKSISNNSYIMTKYLTLKILKLKSMKMFEKALFMAITSAEVTKKNSFDKTSDKKEIIDPFFRKFQDLKIVSNLNFKNPNINPENLDNLLKEAYLSNDTNYNTIYNSIRYKNIGGIKLELNGRLTKRYRADRAKHFIKQEGQLRNNLSSFKRWSNILVRGNTMANQSYSWNKSKRRIGSFAVKGWIVGK